MRLLKQSHHAYARSGAAKRGFSLFLFAAVFLLGSSIYSAQAGSTQDSPSKQQMHSRSDNAINEAVQHDSVSPDADEGVEGAAPEDYPDAPAIFLEDKAMPRSPLMNGVERGFIAIANVLEAAFFFEIPIYGEWRFSFIVLWLIVGAVYFTAKLGFVNVRLFGHAWKVLRGHYTKADEPGEISHYQGLTAALSGTVGIGSIAGVALAISLGGPGAVVWLALAGFLGMSLKFAEVTLSHKYRTMDEKGRVRAGAFYYLSEGLLEQGFPAWFGKTLATIFAFCCLLGALGGGNMLQANQTVSILTTSFTTIHEWDWLVAIVFAVGVGVVLIGGIKRVARIAMYAVPFMVLLYFVCCVAVIVVNAEAVPYAVALMFEEAFDVSAFGGAAVGAMLMGFRRATIANEAGVGSSPIAHAAVRTSEPVRQGAVALLEPFIATFFVCVMTGLVVTVTGVYAGEDIGTDGVGIAATAFATVAPWFPKVLALCILLFAYTTIITWSYYGECAWDYLFGHRTIGLFHGLFVAATFFGGITHFGVVLMFSDLMILAMSLPNMLGLYLLSKPLKRELESYMRRLKEGEFVDYKAKPKKKDEGEEEAEAELKGQPEASA